MDINSDLLEMVSQDNSTQCCVHDKTPGAEIRRINIVVRPHYTVEKVINDITTQFGYEKFDLVLQPFTADLVYLNDCKNSLLYEVPGFDSSIKNILLIFPFGKWDGDVKTHYNLPMRPLKCITTNHQTPQNLQQQIHVSHVQTQSHQQQLTQPPANISSGSYTYSNTYTSYTHTTITTTTTTSNINNNISNNNNINNNNNMSMCIDTVMNSPSTCVPSSPSTTTNVSDSLNLSPMSEHEQLSDDDLALGASASPTETDTMNENGMSLSDAQSHSIRNKFIPINEGDNDGYYKNDDDSTIKPYYEQQMPLAIPAAAPTVKGYVGLVNQAMTCYLNSLLQALYMTPEFRNGLYNWESDNDNEAKSIPYQLQKLFLNLQTSQKSSVETTDLTRSFGWDSSEAWQQHDIQELCRVMFDALEHKFKDTKQSDLISSLYEGKMIDYVKCLECDTEKSREDTFLDIPLPVRPFGNKEAYGSIEEALRAFVQPETLDGNNQYLCEKCNKKCDAHKGLKFKYFPYVLTLHLKRFDFNYQTMHRIKINDRVTFPEMLNLNSFIENTETTNTPSNGTTDDCSTADSGSAMDEDNCSIGIANSISGQNETDMNDEDEGIDMSNGTDHRINNGNSNGNNISTELQDKGPYVYELFAIMIHSGSASGGHYFAYIKEFETNDWFCFNDQSVTPITQEDIEKSYGGGPARAYYSSSYTSSINAYMLMYRQVDPKRNQRAMKIADFPQHINSLLPRLRVEDECRISRVSRHHSSFAELGYSDMIKPRVFFYNPSLKKLKMSRVHISHSFDINSVLETAYQNLDVEQFAPLSRCRLVGYDQTNEVIIQSFENENDPSLIDIRNSYDGTLDYLLEYRADGQEFEIYHPGSHTWHVFMVNLHTMEMDGPFLVNSPSRGMDDLLKHSIAVRLHVKEDELLLATLSSLKAFVAYDPLPTKEAQELLQDIAESRFRHLTFFYLNVPCIDPTSLEILGIPQYEPPKPIYEVSADVVDAVLMNGNNTANSGPMQHSHFDDTVDNANNCVINAKVTRSDTLKGESPLPPPTAYNGSSTVTGHESNSEDSSLSDGDRTLVESTPNRSAGQGANGRSNSRLSSRSHSPDISSPEDEEDRLRTFYANFDDYQNVIAKQTKQLFFHAIKTEALDINTLSSSYYSSTDDDAGRKPTHAYKIIVDSHMKMSEFKNQVEQLLRVPNNYFKILRKQHDSYIQPKQNHPLVFLNEAETLTVELGKILQNDEFKAKICFMRLADMNDDVGKLNTVCEWIHNSTTLASDAKQDLVSKLHRIDAKYHSLTVENCRLWLKSGRNPYKIYNDYEFIATDFRAPLAIEFMVQECENGVKTHVPPDSLTLFVRQWHPDKYELGKFQEITIQKGEDIRCVLSKLSGIPENNIDYCRVNTSFPCTNISVLTINSTMNWLSVSSPPEKYPLNSASSGNVFFYKDNTKEIKELTTEERRSLNIREKIRLDRLGSVTVSRYSPRRERALKIYLDSPQTSAKRQDLDQAVDN